MTRNSYRSRRNEPILNISEKANKILNIILISLIIVIFRIWHIGVIQHEDKVEDSKKPQRRTVLEASKRATIRDRFNIPLAVNQISYRAVILYSQLRQIPSIGWEKDSSGKKIKKFKRKDYITDLSKLLGNELNLDPLRLEDLIHAKGSFFGQVPFIIKEDLSEKEYYRLKMLEKDWLGFQVQKVSKRQYPKGRVASDIIGSMGSINRQEYDKIMQEIKQLEEFISGGDAEDDLPLPKGVETLADAKLRLQQLLDHAYTINDFVGKTGIEASFENTLRGYHGRKSFYSDSRGNFLKELPGTKVPLAGQRVLLTISSELQEYAEQLLMQNERIRETKLSKHLQKKTKQPWIKGGAIVAIDPNNGDVLALASYPRIDPNDFIPSGNPETAKEKISRIVRWFESDTYVGEMWDLKRPLERERFDDEKQITYDEPLEINWSSYLKIILKENGPLALLMKEIKLVQQAVDIQNQFEQMLKLLETDNAFWVIKTLYGDDKYKTKSFQIPLDQKVVLEEKLKEKQEQIAILRKNIDPAFNRLPLNYDKILLLDLCKLAVDKEKFTLDLQKKLGKTSLEDYKKTASSYTIVKDALQKMAKEIFHEQSFRPWRLANEKEFLKEKRVLEKASNLYPKPYIDYFDKQEQEMFLAFWKEEEWSILYSLLTGEKISTKEELSPYLEHFAKWHEELQQGAHSSLPWKVAYDYLQKTMATIDLDIAKEYFASFRSFTELNKPLYGKYRYLRKYEGQYTEKSLAAAFYPTRGYGYGRSQGFRQAATQGSIFKLVTSYEALKQRYQSLQGAKITLENLNPLTMTDRIFRKGKDKYVGYHEDGKPIPVHYNGGRMLRSATVNLGKIDLLRALENSSNPYFSLLAAEYIKSPKDLELATRAFCFGKQTGIALPGEISGRVPDDLETNKTGLYAMANGQHTLVVTPLQTSIMLSSLVNGGKVLKPHIVKLIAGKTSSLHTDSLETLGTAYGQTIQTYPTEIKTNLFMPIMIRNMLLTGMRKVVLKQLADGLTSLSRFYKEYPGAIADYLDLKDVIVGKTSTSESMENIDLDAEEGTNLYTHVWFGGIAFDKEISDQVQSLVYRDDWGNPELVVVVYLKYGSWGKESAPIGAQMVKKWREIKAKHVY